MLSFFIKYIALVFLLAALVVYFFWARPAHGAEGSGWLVGLLVLIAVVIMYISRRNTGKFFTDQSGGH
jgi:RsiW-degrading membrane proteinase PrsW (M82 family)